MSPIRLFLADPLCVLCVLCGSITGADDVIGWRTDGSGAYPRAIPVLKWSATKNVKWVTRMPDWSNSQPVPAGDRVFTLCEPYTLLCVDAANGKILWQRANTFEEAADPAEWKQAQVELKQAGEINEKIAVLKRRIESLEKQIKADKGNAALKTEIGDAEKSVAAAEEQLKTLPLAHKWQFLKTHKTLCGYTTATPTTDGKHVWAVFGNAVIACYDREGNRQWITKSRDFPQSEWGHSASPLLVGDTLIVVIDDVVGLDAATGKERWRTRYAQTWGSPVHARIGDVDVAVLANGKILRVSDGKVLARGQSLSNVSALIDGNRIYCIQMEGAAFELPAEIGNSFPIPLKELWKTEAKGRNHFACPVLHEGLIYSLSATSVLSVIDATDGKVLTERRLDLGSGTVYPSLAVAGGHLFASSDNGTTLVLAPGREPQEVARNQLDRFMSSPVFYGKRMYLRTHQNLWCIGE